MAETAGAFWIAHTYQAQSAADVKAFLVESRIRPAWISSIHAIGSLDLAGYSAMGIPAGCVVYSWPQRVFSGHRVVHTAVRSILLGETEMALLLDSSAAVLLASHIAVGRHNLFPLATFGAFSAFNHSELPLLEKLASSLAVQSPESASPNALLIEGSSLKRPVKKGTRFENAAWVHNPEPDSALAGCCSVLDALFTSGRKHGLAVDVEPGGLTLYTSLERM